MVTLNLSVITEQQVVNNFTCNEVRVLFPHL